MLAPIHKDHNFKIEISLVLEMLQTKNSDNWLKIVNRRCTAQNVKRRTPKAVGQLSDVYNLNKRMNLY